MLPDVSRMLTPVAAPASESLHPIDDRVRDHVQVRSTKDGLDERPIRAVALSSMDAQAVPTASIQITVVEERIESEAGFHRRIDEHVGEPVELIRNAGTQQFLELLVGGAHVIPAPARATGLLPAVEILTRPAQVDHAVDRAGAAEHTSPRQPVASVGGARLRHRLVVPVDLRAPQLEVLRRRSDEWMRRRPTRLHEGDGQARVVGQSSSQRTPSRACTNDYDVEAIVHVHHLFTALNSRSPCPHSGARGVDRRRRR